MLPNISMLHCAGLRLGAPEFPEPDTWETFEALLSLCRAKGAELLLIAGNLFEQEWVSQEDVERVARSLGSLPGTSVFVTPADRDPLVQTSVYRLVEWPDNVHIFSSAIAGIECLAGKARVYGCAWAAYQQHDWGFLREFHITAETDRAQIMLLPVSLPESVMRDSGLHYAALGIEDHWSGAIRRSERTFWADCGMLTPRDSGALGSYGVVWGELAAEESRFEFIELGQRTPAEDSNPALPPVATMDRATDAPPVAQAECVTLQQVFLRQLQSGCAGTGDQEEQMYWSLVRQIGLSALGQGQEYED